MFLKKVVLEDIPDIYHSQKKTIMLPPDLLSSIEKVIRNDFCMLKTSDPLSDALALVKLQEANDIMIVDNNGKFAGSISALSVLSKVPPQVSDVPVRYHIENPTLIRQVIDSIVDIIKIPIGDVFKPKKPTRCFYKDGYLIYTIEELAKPYRNYGDSKIIPILNNDETIEGVVSYQGILEYIQSDPIWLASKIEELFTEKLRIGELFKLLPEDTLDKACFAMDYLPIEYILICDRNNNLLGMVDRYQVSALTHPLYFHLMDIPLSEIMKPVESLYLVEVSQNVKSLIDSFLNLGIKAAIAVERLANEIRPLRVVTPVNILQRCLQNFRSHQK
jgi:predicted transcriptional regulator